MKNTIIYLVAYINKNDMKRYTLIKRLYSLIYCYIIKPYSNDGLLRKTSMSVS